MTILTPRTSDVQGFQVRTRPSSSSSVIGPETVDLYFVNEDTNQEIHITPISASYDEFGFLEVSASMYLTGSEIAANFSKTQNLSLGGAITAASV